MSNIGREEREEMRERGELTTGLDSNVTSMIPFFPSPRSMSSKMELPVKDFSLVEDGEG
jgi:hypothetical protein